MEARGFALMATTDSCPEFVLRYMMVLSRSFWVRHPWHAECAIVCKRVFAVQGKLHPAAEMRQIVGLEKPAYQTHRNDTAGRGGRKMPRLRRLGSVKQWQTEHWNSCVGLEWLKGFGDFSSLIVPETGPLKKPILSTSSESLKSQAPYEEMLPREASGETRACWGHCLVYQDGKRWETYLSYHLPPQFSEWKWLECYGLFPVVRFGCIAQDLGQHVRFANSQERRVARKAASEEDHSSSRCLKGIALQVSHHIY